MNTFSTMLKTELKLSLRDMNMIIFAICVPIVVAVILGIIYGNEPAYDGAEYTFLAQSFGALSTIAILAGGVMGLPMTISDYREKKILKRFKVTPVSPAMILVVQLVIYALYSITALFLVFATLSIFFDYYMVGSWLQFLASHFLTMITMFSIGMLVGGVAPNAKIASVIACLLYFPMLIFSGATLPYEVMPETLQRFADMMPLTQGIKLLQATSLGLPIEGVLIPIIIMAALAVVCITISIIFFKWE